MKKRILIAGAGASGMTAAIFAARKGCSVTLLEGREKAGKKLLATGNGKCNFTNRRMDFSCFHSETPEQVRAVLSRFTAADTLSYMESIGIQPMEKNGYYYPASGQAAAVTQALEMELSHLGVRLVCAQQVTGAVKEKDGFAVTAVPDRRIYRGDCLILSCGSRAGIPQEKALDGYGVAKQLGHSLTEMAPGLTGLCARGRWMKKWSGVRMDGRVTVYSGKQELAADRGEIQLTDYGISGIPVFQVSRFVSLALKQHRKVEAVVDFFPDFSISALSDLLEQRKKRMGYRTDEQLLIGLVPQKMIPVFLERGAYGSRLAACMKQFSMEIFDTNPISQSQICAGGVPLTEICADTMESKKTPGLYLTGEMLDADGMCGGYNLQWAWATGAIAGRSAGR